MGREFPPVTINRRHFVPQETQSMDFVLSTDSLILPTSTTGNRSDSGGCMSNRRMCSSAMGNYTSPSATPASHSQSSNGTTDSQKLLQAISRFLHALFIDPGPRCYSPIFQRLMLHFYQTICNKFPNCKSKQAMNVSFFCLPHQTIRLNLV